MALLETADLTVTFGGVRAVDGVSLAVDERELVGLIGPNGAGKTSAIDAISGFVAHRGRVAFAGRDLTGLSPHRRAAAGLARTWQSVELFDDLTVAENCLVAAERQTTRSVVRDVLRPPRRRRHDAVDRALDLVGLGGDAGRRPDHLSLGQRKLAGLARALAAEPRLVLLDEPAAGLDTAETGVLGDTLEAVAATGVAVLLVDHDMGLVLSRCTKVFVLDEGRIIADGSPAAVRDDPRVLAAYLGERA